MVFSNIGSTKTLLFSGFDQNAQINWITCKNSELMAGSQYPQTTRSLLKTGLLSLYYTPPGLFIIRIKVLNSDIRSSVKGHYSAALSSPPQITILLFVPKGIQNLLTIPNSRLLLSLSPFLLLLVLLAGSVFTQDPSELSANQLTLQDWAQFIINVLKCSNNPTVQASQTGHKIDRNDPDSYKCL